MCSIHNEQEDRMSNNPCLHRVLKFVNAIDSWYQLTPLWSSFKPTSTILGLAISHTITQGNREAKAGNRHGIGWECQTWSVIIYGPLSLLLYTHPTREVDHTVPAQKPHVLLNRCRWIYQILNKQLSVIKGRSQFGITSQLCSNTTLWEPLCNEQLHILSLQLTLKDWWRLTKPHEKRLPDAFFSHHDAAFDWSGLDALPYAPQLPMPGRSFAYRDVNWLALRDPLTSTPHFWVQTHERHHVRPQHRLS